MPHDLVADFEARGLVQQSTDPTALREWLATPGRRVYAGFDPTADSLHVGHLVALERLAVEEPAAAGQELHGRSMRRERLVPATADQCLE